MKWSWVEDQVVGADYWNESFPPAHRLKFRRTCWPEGWRIWMDDHYMSSKYSPYDGWLQGYGGQEGADDPQKVMVNGIELLDGVCYYSTDDDLKADDWERM